MPLTDVQARKAAPREKSYKLADSAGLYLFITPQGRRSWRMKYRSPAKKGFFRSVPGNQPGRGAREARRSTTAAARA
jgi:hypothetical protein